MDDIEQSMKEMMVTTDKHGPGAVEDWEVDELLEWTNGLNFDSYVSSWKECGTSAKFEAIDFFSVLSMDKLLENSRISLT